MKLRWKLGQNQNFRISLEIINWSVALRLNAFFAFHVNSQVAASEVFLPCLEGDGVISFSLSKLTKQPFLLHRLSEFLQSTAWPHYILGRCFEQPFDCDVIQNCQTMYSMPRSMDWTLEGNMVDGLFFCATLTGRRGGHTPFVQAGA